MKVNPLGVQAYQQLNRQDRPLAGGPEAQTDRTPTEKVVIEPQSQLNKSSLAVKAPSGSYAEFLSSDERQALDMLFAKFSNSARFGPAYSAGQDEAAPKSTLGRVIDVQV